MSALVSALLDERLVTRLRAPASAAALDALLAVEALVFDRKAGVWLGLNGTRVATGDLRALVQLHLVAIAGEEARLTDSGVVVARAVLTARMWPGGAA